LLLVEFTEWRHVFIAKPEIERQVLTCSPIVLDEKINCVGAEVVLVRSRLKRCLLGKAQQEICKGHSAGPAGKDERPAGVAGIAGVQHLAAEVATPTPIVLTPSQTHGIADGDVLRG